MNPETLVECLDLIGRYLLNDDPAFCGSDDGRRLSALLRQARPAKIVTGSGAPPSRIELVTRTVSLPIELNNALTVVAEAAGVSTNKVIETAVASAVHKVLFP